MAIKQSQRGFTLLIAVIFMSVMLAFGLALSSLAYKQITLASTATDSQYAFYAADSALECALYYDQQQQSFDYASHPSGTPPGPVTCNNQLTANPSYTPPDGTKAITTYRMQIDANRCADVTIYKYANPTSVTSNSITRTVTTYMFAQGYSVACSAVGTNPRMTARGEDIYY
ncbi:MAG: hypothetical protein JWN18_281 [Parcubacteria group bacterium]|nr:hypothetical protein [Parcubacteria group bacterium]